MNGYLILYDGLTIELLGLNLTSHVLDQELSLYYEPESIKQTTISTITNKGFHFKQLYLYLVISAWKCIIFLLILVKRNVICNILPLSSIIIFDISLLFFILDSNQY